MSVLVDRFRRWYEYERDCNAKCLTMLSSVPAERRGTPEFARALGRMGHLVAARLRWLARLGHFTNPPSEPFPSYTLEELPGKVAETEAAWTRYLAALDDAELNREFEWSWPDGKRFRWNVEGVLTQTFGHAWYHRGQIAQLVAQLGGQAVDTDYIFWSKPTRLDV